MTGPVAICFGTYPPERNGGSDFVARLASALARKGIEPHVITSAEGKAGSSEEEGVIVHRVVRDWSLGRQGLADVRRVDRILEGAGVRVLHVLFPDSVHQGGYQLPALLGLGRVPIVATWWNLGLGRRSPLAVRAESLALLLRARVLTSHDPSYLSVLRRAALGRPAEWLPVGNNLLASSALPERGEARRHHGLDEEAFWLGFFGQLDPTRGVEDLFAALQRVRRRHDVRLLMIGSAGRPERYEADASSAAYLEQVRSLSGALGIDDAVRWTGYLSDEDVVWAFGAIDLCVLPYRRNSIGRSALATALETGTPTVLAGTPAGIEPLRAAEHVALVPREDPVALAGTLAWLAEDQEARERLRVGARDAARLFSWDQVAERATAIYGLLN